MYVLVTYDVATTTPQGRRRLRQAAQACLDYGQRVQNSVFEMEVDPAQWTVCKDRLLRIVNLEEDSIRFDSVWSCDAFWRPTCRRQPKARSTQGGHSALAVANPKRASDMPQVRD